MINLQKEMDNHTDVIKSIYEVAYMVDVMRSKYETKIQKLTKELEMKDKQIKELQKQIDKVNEKESSQRNRTFDFRLEEDKPTILDEYIEFLNSSKSDKLYEAYKLFGI